MSGDSNPLHVDPKVAIEAGFDRPILHSLAAYGIVGRALVEALCEDRPERLRRLDVRFSTPVYPGETFEIDIWRDGRGTAAFRVRLVERGLMAQQNGYAQFDA